MMCEECTFDCPGITKCPFEGEMIITYVKEGFLIGD